MGFADVEVDERNDKPRRDEQAGTGGRRLAKHNGAQNKSCERNQSSPDDHDGVHASASFVPTPRQPSHIRLAGES
ncbi:MAG TPA: hypothetical protein VFI87_10670 [Hyphomicrobiaceae bacterium]|jgi:hypothetical protein|nr:hypothetical protein [Hyphomicrobiaceae bacterium]